MTGLPAHWRQFAAKLGVAARLLLLLGAMAVLLAVLAPLALAVSGWMGLAAAAVAAVACLLGGAAAMLAGELVKVEKAVAARMIFEMLLRMGLPLAVCVAVFLKGPALIDAGFPYYLLAFYLPLLGLEILLSLARVEHRAAGQGVTAYGR